MTNPIEPYVELIAHYRERWAFHGHDPADAVVGAGSAGCCAAKTSQTALDEYRPIFESRLATATELGLRPVFTTLELFQAGVAPVLRTSLPSRDLW